MHLPDRSFWDNYWSKEIHGELSEFIFGPLLAKYLYNVETYLEIGCSPGTSLIHFANHYGYQVNGIDYSSLDLTRSMLQSHGISNYKLFEEDFLYFQSDETFDVVASYGFVEHFDHPEHIIHRQASFVKPGGYLIVEVPNIRYFNYLLYRIFQPELLKVHNRTIMNINTLQRSVLDLEDFTILYCNFYKTSFISFNIHNAMIAAHPLRRLFMQIARRTLDIIHMNDIPNRFFSPYLILVARKNSIQS